MNIVVYKTKTGHTKEYAEMIASELQCDVVSIDDTNKKTIRQYDTIIYGAPVYIGKMKGASKMKRWAKHKQLVLFACGADKGKEETVAKYKSKVVSEEDDTVAFFYTPGGMDFEKLTGFPKFMLGMVRNMMRKSTDLSEDDKEFLDSLEHPTSYVDKTHIIPIIDFVTGR